MGEAVGAGPDAQDAAISATTARQPGNHLDLRRRLTSTTRSQLIQDEVCQDHLQGLGCRPERLALVAEGGQTGADDEDVAARCTPTVVGAGCSYSSMISSVARQPRARSGQVHPRARSDLFQ